MSYIGSLGGTTLISNSTMKIIAALTLTSVLVCLSGCRSTRIERVARPLTIRVDGSPGASFTGTVKADGVTQKVSGTVPSELRFASRQLVCSFQQGAEPGAVRFEVIEGERLVGSSATTGPRGHCRFTVREGAIGSTTSWRFTRE